MKQSGPRRRYRKNARQIQNAIRRTDGLSRAAELLEACLGAPRPVTPPHGTPLDRVARMTKTRQTMLNNSDIRTK